MKKIIKKILLFICHHIEILIWTVEKKCGFAKEENQFLLNINKNFGEKQKRVLISYMDYVYVGKALVGSVKHTNYYELCQIIRYFLKNNYILDICACDDVNIISYARKQNYDVIFGLGEVFRRVCAESSAYKILYMTENPYLVSFAREKERIEYFYKRHKIEIPLVRTGVFFQEDDEKLADAIICMGDEKYLSATKANVKRIFPTALVNPEKIVFNNRNTKSFIVLGTYGFVHKGVDLLIEIFSQHRDWNLYLCGNNIHKELKALKYLPITKNIYDCGYIDVMGKQFVKLAEECTYILLPSCSEGLPTAILTGMRHGLLPIVMKGNGLDEQTEYCLYFENYSLECIENTIKQAIACSPDECIKQAEKVMAYAKNTFTIENFTKNMEDIFDGFIKQEILAERCS